MNQQEEKTMRKTMTAPCDIFEDQGKIILRIDMPGVTKENLTLRVENDELRITGKRAAPENSDGRRLIREIPDRDFFQAYTLDSTIDRGNIQAELVKGQLLITLSVKESEKPRRIDITASD